jgi:hypothetical protein
MRIFDDPDLFYDHLETTNACESGACLDKAWHGIHFMLTGESKGGHPPLSFLDTGGRVLEVVDMGPLPTRGLLAAEVAKIAKALANVNFDMAIERNDPCVAPGHVYPSGIWKDDHKTGHLYIRHHFEELRTFMVETARRGEAAIVFSL